MPTSVYSPEVEAVLAGARAPQVRNVDVDGAQVSSGFHSRPPPIGGIDGSTLPWSISSTIRMAARPRCGMPRLIGFRAVRLKA